MDGDEDGGLPLNVDLLTFKKKYYSCLSTKGSVQNIDKKMKYILIQNNFLTDSQRALVSHSVKFGGLDIYITKLAAFPAFITSMVLSEELQRRQVRTDVELMGEANELLVEWNVSSGVLEYVSIDKLRKIAKPQQWLTEKGCLIQHNVLVTQGNARFKTLVYVCSSLSSGSWTSSLPSPFYGTFMSPTAYMCALRYRTGHPVFSRSAMCHACRQRISDAGGDHNFFCQGDGRLIQKYHLVRDKLFALTQETCLSSRSEIGHLIGDGGLKPADILLPSWNGGRDLCLDVSIVFPFSSLTSVSKTGETVRKAKDRNVVKYESRVAVRGVITVEALASVRHQLAFTTQKTTTGGFLMRSNETE